MDIIRKKINQVAGEVIMKGKNDIVAELKGNPFIIVYNKYQQIYDLGALLETELAEKLHGREKFELIVLSGNEEPEIIRHLMEEMAEDCIQKPGMGMQVLARATLELVVADNHCSIEMIDMIHSMACKVFHEEKGFKLEYTDYLVFDLSSQEPPEVVSAGWLKELEIYYKDHSFIPVICTEELLVKREERYKKSIETIACIITMNAVSVQNINVQAERKTTWRCAAHMKDDKLWHFIAGLFYKFMSEQNSHRMSEQGYVRYIESFLQDYGITINPGEVAREMKGMPMNLESILPDSINPLLVIKRTKLIAADEVITKIYGNNNPVRKYADLNYLDMHISGQKEYLWEKFQANVPGTRKDIETYLEDVIRVMIRGREEEIQKSSERLDDYKNIKITLNMYAGKDNKAYVEKLFKDIMFILQLKAELENQERELAALKYLYSKVMTLEFRQRLQDIKEKQNKIIDFLKNKEQDSFAYFKKDCGSMLNELFKSEGYWKMETIEDGIRKQITQNLNLHSQEMFEWQKEEHEKIFCSFLNNVWKRKNMLHNNHAMDFWTIRNDRLRPALAEHEYIYINKCFFEEDTDAGSMLNINFPKAELVKTAYQNIFSIEYINIRDMDCLELLATVRGYRDAGKDANNR